MCTLCVSGAPGQKRPSDPLELELRMIASCCVDKRNLGPLEEQPMLLNTEPPPPNVFLLFAV